MCHVERGPLGNGLQRAKQLLLAQLLAHHAQFLRGDESVLDLELGSRGARHPILQPVELVDGGQAKPCRGAEHGQGADDQSGPSLTPIGRSRSKRMEPFPFRGHFAQCHSIALTRDE